MLANELLITEKEKFFDHAIISNSRRNKYSYSAIFCKFHRGGGDVIITALTIITESKGLLSAGRCPQLDFREEHLVF